MALSQTALQAVLAQATAEVFLECLTISHADLATPLRLVNDRKDLTRTAGTFTAFPFAVTGIRQSADQLPQMSLTIDNVDQRVILALRSLAGTRSDITVTYEVVLAGTPNTVEYGPVDFRMADVNESAVSLVLDLEYHSGFLNKAFPALQFSPSNALALAA